MSAFVKEVVVGLPDSAMETWSVCSTAFSQIGDTEAVIASLDGNGRGFCNDLEVIFVVHDVVVDQRVSVWMVDNVSDTIRDVDNDGRKELVVPLPASEYEGSSGCVAVWPAIYLISRGRLVEQSASFKKFYHTELEKMQSDLVTARAQDEGNGEDQAVCLQIETDKIKRVSGVASDAGEEAALQWIASNEESKRLKGIAVLADIRDKRSLTALQGVSHDSNPVVAAAAGRALSARNIK